MANVFKVKTNDAMPSSSGVADTLYTGKTSTTTVVIGLILCNVHSTSVTASVKLESNKLWLEPVLFFLLRSRIISGSEIVLKLP